LLTVVIGKDVRSQFNGAPEVLCLLIFVVKKIIIKKSWCIGKAKKANFFKQSTEPFNFQISVEQQIISDESTSRDCNWIFYYLYTAFVWMD